MLPHGSKFIAFLFCLATASSYWDSWWTYEGISGPSYWGLINPDWRMCDKGRQQSPINVEPQNLLYDPNLKPIQIDKSVSDGVMENRGQMLVYKVNGSSKVTNITGGPLGAYQYQFHELLLHFGNRDDRGSEHTIDAQTFPGEVQIYAYNADLYNSFQQALTSPRGLVIISVLFYIGKEEAALNAELRRLASVVPDVLYKGQAKAVDHFSLYWLLPRTAQFVTYEGSITHPGCYETVTWIVMNKPIYISPQDLTRLRDVHRSETKQDVPLKMANNHRPIQPLNKRVVRTNIDFKFKQSLPGRQCRSPLDVEVFYRANPNFPFKQRNDEM